MPLYYSTLYMLVSRTAKTKYASGYSNLSYRSKIISSVMVNIIVDSNIAFFIYLSNEIEILDRNSNLKLDAVA